MYEKYSESVFDSFHIHIHRFAGCCVPSSLIIHVGFSFCESSFLSLWLATKRLHSHVHFMKTNLWRNDVWMKEKHMLEWKLGKEREKCSDIGDDEDDMHSITHTHTLARHKMYGFEWNHFLNGNRLSYFFYSSSSSFLVFKLACRCSSTILFTWIPLYPNMYCFKSMQYCSLKVNKESTENTHKTVALLGFDFQRKFFLYIFPSIGEQASECTQLPIEARAFAVGWCQYYT